MFARIEKHAHRHIGRPDEEVVAILKAISKSPREIRNAVVKKYCA